MSREMQQAVSCWMDGSHFSSSETNKKNLFLRALGSEMSEAICELN